MDRHKVFCQNNKICNKIIQTKLTSNQIEKKIKPEKKSGDKQINKIYIKKEINKSKQNGLNQNRIIPQNRWI